MTLNNQRIEVFATCPQSKGASHQGYLQHVQDVARWSEQSGCAGILVYADNGLVDPWLVSQAILQSTVSLSPLVAVQPVYMHPYAAAKKVASLAFLHHRRIFLNMIAGGFKNDLIALGDNTPHDDRYLRLTEYTSIIQQLLECKEPVTFHGKYYQVSNLSMTPPLPPELRPGVFVSGSSNAGLKAAQALGAVPIKYPACPSNEQVQNAVDGISPGLRIGIIARESAEEAWRVAHHRFPPNREGQLAHQLAMKTSDSQWHRQLSELAVASANQQTPYWLGPFENYRTFCPYLVGNYEQVSEHIERYIEFGFRTFILDIPPSEEELMHTSIVFHHAQEMALC